MRADTADLSDLQDDLATIARRVTVAALACDGLAALHDRHGDVARVDALQRSAERLRAAWSYLQSTAVLLRVAEDGELPPPAALTVVADVADPDVPADGVPADTATWCAGAGGSCVLPDAHRGDCLSPSPSGAKLVPQVGG